MIFNYGPPRIGLVEMSPWTLRLDSTATLHKGQLLPVATCLRCFSTRVPGPYFGPTATLGDSYVERLFCIAHINDWI